MLCGRAVEKPAWRGSTDESSIITGHSIVCISQDWQGDPTSKTHIMRILATRNRVLWVNSIGMRRPMASRADVQRLFAKLRRSLSGCRPVAPNLFVMDPLAIPLPGVGLADRLNAALLATSIRRFCKRHGLERPLLWTFLPHVSWLLGRLGERLAIYHCVDEYAAFSGVPRETIIRLERDLVRRAHVVFTSAEKLRDERRSLNPNTYFIPHGVDVAHFSRALDPSTVIPDDLHGLPRPVIGFFGLLADWVDLDLIRALAVARPQWSIALIGKAVTDLGPLRNVPNVHLLGQKPYATLPGYCRGFDVGLIPFRTNDLTMRVNPLKLREYLAAGLPVVSTPLPEVARYRGLVRLADDVPSFLAGIEAAIGERTDAMARCRVEAMRAEGWESRVAWLSAIVTEHLRATP
jgi:glycosyltransferase involved in cell wall biosynthesis